MVYDGWLDLVRVFVKGIIKGIIGYAAIILVLRVSGKRTLTKLNAFDFTVTVALGSTLASTLLTKSVTVAEGSVAFITLAALQFTVSWLSVRSSAFQLFIKSEPTLLLRDGRSWTARCADNGSCTASSSPCCETPASPRSMEWRRSYSRPTAHLA